MPSPIPNSSTGGYLLPSTVAPLDDEMLQRKINHVICGVTGIPGELVRPRWMPEPVGLPTIATNWIAFGETSRLNERGTPFMKHVGRAYDVDGEEIPYEGHDVLTRHEIIVYLASCYGPACYSTAALLRDGIFVLQNWEELQAYGVILTEVGNIVPMPELVNNRWYQRCDIELRVAREIERVYPILNILRADGPIHAAGSDRDIQQTWDTENVT